MKTYSFPRGGIYFEDSTVPAKDSSVIAFLPGLSVIPLVQHAGGRAYPIVSVGDYVKEGMLIGRGQGLGSTNIHATVPGKVVRMVSRKTADGQTGDALVIRLEGAFEKLGKPEEIFPWEGLSPFDLQRLISEYGIVEMEGSGHPISDMLSGLHSAREPLTLVVRCVFDDPWLAADYALCRERIKAVVEGSVILARAGRIGRIVFAVSRTEQALGASLLAEAESWDIPFSLVPVGSRYPQRNRRELELVLRLYEKKEDIPLGSLLILGPATLAAVHDAVKLKKPILDRYVTVGGAAVKNPQVMKVRIGTRMGEIFAECGGFVDKPKRIASGSPLLGRVVADLDEPIIKTTYAVFAIPEARLGGTVARSCIGCGECRSVCPVGLDPEELFKIARIRRNREALAALAAECHGCGCCEVVCPSRLPLSTTIADAAVRRN
ncbi:MAG: SLBB domain-containing protein [Treponema sp.]|jgi:electron transport complex protein RnfC|nr:SLBB domain-containing protein [Treponema sp.]